MHCKECFASTFCLAVIKQCGTGSLSIIWELAHTMESGHTEQGERNPERGVPGGHPVTHDLLVGDESDSTPCCQLGVPGLSTTASPTRHRIATPQRHNCVCPMGWAWLIRTHRLVPSHRTRLLARWESSAAMPRRWDQRGPPPGSTMDPGQKEW